MTRRVRPRHPYPPVGRVAVMKSGNRVMVWPEEGHDARCFAGQLLEQGASPISAVSAMWLRSAVIRCEAPTADDRASSLVDLDGVS